MMQPWIALSNVFSQLSQREQAALNRLQPMPVPKHQTLFHPGDIAEGFVIVLTGRIDVYLTGPSGREILLYSVAPGQSCVQTTVGLMGQQAYTGEAITAADCEVVLIPRAQFKELMDTSAVFREFVFSAFANRVQGMMHVLEMVAFHKVEARLAADLLERSDGGAVKATQAELAAHIGSAREVVARQLDTFAKRGLIERERGAIRLLNADALQKIAAISREV